MIKTFFFVFAHWFKAQIETLWTTGDTECTLLKASAGVTWFGASRCDAHWKDWACELDQQSSVNTFQEAPFLSGSGFYALAIRRVGT